ncbi:hypothetical protein A0H81_14088 [Grifola frondosa]|uniref:Uncharacterized protein n=1 Tax=Grifola frondosa TaxID=5627 RepID=A0A1C7LPL0_GRIFR|nr:hypothetical protein A0H81_14088 [Grifola frondosa]
MHRALGVYDVLREIFLQLSPPIPDLDRWDSKLDEATGVLTGDGRAERQALARSARVCRMFADPALDALWRRLEGFVPLLELISCFQAARQYDSDYEDEEEDDGEDIAMGHQVLAGEITTDDWARFQSYARRVRKLSYVTRTAPDPAALFYLYRYNHGKPLLPLLKELRWRPNSPSDTSALLLVPEHLIRLRIEFGGFLSNTQRKSRSTRDHSIEMLLRSLHSQVPLVKDLELTGWFNVLSLLPVAAFSHLRKMDVRDIDLDMRVLRALSALPCLAELTASVSIGPGEYSHCSGFPSLHFLTLNGRASSIARLFTAISPPLESLYITSSSTHPASYLACFELMRTKFSSLRHLCVAALGRCNTEVRLTELILPLLALHKLEHVLFRSRFTRIAMPDADMELMAGGWRALKLLMLSFVPWDTLPSVQALAHFARCCPQLSIAMLPALDVRAPLPAEPFPAYEHGLHRLHITEPLEIADPVPIARFIDAIFPQLDPTVPPGGPSVRRRSVSRRNRRCRSSNAPFASSCDEIDHQRRIRVLVVSIHKRILDLRDGHTGAELLALPLEEPFKWCALHHPAFSLDWGKFLISLRTLSMIDGLYTHWFCKSRSIPSRAIIVGRYWD